MAEVNQQRLQVCFSGWVQGIGFRFTARRLASRFRVSGFVRNLPDGRVEIVAEGEAAELQSFLESVKEHLGQYIRRAEENWQPARGEFSGFDIRF